MRHLLRELHTVVNLKTSIEESYQSHSSDRHTTKTKFWIDLKKLAKITLSGDNGNKKVEFEPLEASPEFIQSNHHLFSLDRD